MTLTGRCLEPGRRLEGCVELEAQALVGVWDGKAPQCAGRRKLGDGGAVTGTRLHAPATHRRTGSRWCCHTCCAMAPL